MKEECKHEWRPIVDVNKLEDGCGSEGSRIGSYCLKCGEQRTDTHLMEKGLNETTT